MPRAIATRGACPLQVQVTLDTSGRMLLGTDIAAAMVTLEALRADVIGLNCSTGPEHMRQPVRFLGENSRLPISVIPNAGIPHNEGGEAPSIRCSPDAFADAHEEFVTRVRRERGGRLLRHDAGAHARESVERVCGARAAAARRAARAARLQCDDGVRPGAGARADADRRARQRAGLARQVKRMLLADDYDGVLEVAAAGRGRRAPARRLRRAHRAAGRGEQMRTVVKLLAQASRRRSVIDSTEAT
jgi:5-methyltetrahydrofolate--homocysteine methyltransferase